MGESIDRFMKNKKGPPFLSRCDTGIARGMCSAKKLRKNLLAYFDFIIVEGQVFQVELTEEEAKMILVALKNLRQTTTKETVPEGLHKLYLRPFWFRDAIDLLIGRFMNLPYNIVDPMEQCAEQSNFAPCETTYTAYPRMSLITIFPLGLVSCAIMQLTNFC